MRLIALIIAALLIWMLTGCQALIKEAEDECVNYGYTGNALAACTERTHNRNLAQFSGSMQGTANYMNSQRWGQIQSYPRTYNMNVNRY